MALHSVNGLSLCSGYDGLGIACGLVWPDYRTVCHVEREAYAAAVLAARMEDGSMAPATIWDDLATFDGRPWRGVVDIVTAGLPCQPYSIAGQQRGHDDERAIWPEFVRIVSEVRAPLVFIENVAAFTRWFRPVGEALCGLGYELEAGLWSAAEVGAPHRRERFFCLGQLADAGQLSEGRGAATGEAAGRWAQDGPPGCGDVLGDTDEQGLEGWRREGERSSDEWLTGSSGLPLFPPGPTDRDVWRRILASRPDLAPATQPEVRAVDDGTSRGMAGREPSTRADELQLLGNGVVPQCAAVALEALLERSTWFDLR